MEVESGNILLDPPMEEQEGEGFPWGAEVEGSGWSWADEVERDEREHEKEASGSSGVRTTPSTPRRMYQVSFAF